MSRFYAIHRMLIHEKQRMNEMMKQIKIENEIIRNKEMLERLNKNMWCAQFKSAERTFDLSQPSLFCVDTIRTCRLSATHMNKLIVYVEKPIFKN